MLKFKILNALKQHTLLIACIFSEIFLTSLNQFYSTNIIKDYKLKSRLQLIKKLKIKNLETPGGMLI